MNKQIEKNFSTSNPGVNLQRTKNKKLTWNFDEDGSGQRKRYLRSLNDKTAA